MKPLKRKRIVVVGLELPAQLYIAVRKFGNNWENGIIPYCNITSSWKPKNDIIVPLSSL